VTYQKTGETMINKPKCTNNLHWQNNGWGFYPLFAYKRKQTFTVSLYTLKVIYALQGTSAPEGTERAEGLIHYSLPLMALILLCLGGTANAGDTANHYHIPAQPLSSALLQFAEDSKLELIVKADKLRGFNSGGLDGSMTPAQALSQLLQGSGMTYRFVDAKTVTVEQLRSNFKKTANVEESPELQSSSDTTLPKVTVEADAENDLYDPINTTDPYNKSYSVSDAATATKSDTLIMDTPTSIQVIPKAIMRDQQVIRVEDALKNVSGVNTTGGNGNLYDGFTIRGFYTDNNIYRNGVRSQWASFETAHLEQIDVVKGPGAMLYGRIEPGGFFNVVTKKPLDQPYYSVQQQFGSYDLYRTTIDATGPITDDKSLLYRVNLAYQDRSSFRDIVSNERFFIAPTLTWRPTDKDEVRVSFEFRDESLVDDYGIPGAGNRPASIPLNRFLGDKGQLTRKEEFLTELYASHAFNDDWKINGQFTYNDYDYDYREVYHLNGLTDKNNNGTNADESQLDRFFYNADELYEVYNTSLWLTGKFDLFGTRHETTIGGDYYFFELAALSFNGQATTLNIFNPVYGTNDLSFRPKPDFNSLTRQQWYGLYFQDHITLFDKLHILGGGRYDWAQNQGAGTAGTPITNADITKQQTTAFSPRVGILYQPWNWLSLYANWTESFGLNNGRSSTGIPLSPETATQYEGGFKFAFFDGRLNSTLAYFDITKNNISVPVRPGVSETIGQANSSGFEWDINGQLTEKLNLIANYAYTDARFTRDDDGSLVGNRLFNVPRNSGSVWLKYDLTDRFSIGSGVYIVDQREGNKENTFQLPGYVRWDAMAAYRVDIKDFKLTAQVNVNNILDKSYFKSALGFADSALPGDPISVLGSLRLEY
jgi:iron complex outermembrane recepter protein